MWEITTAFRKYWSKGKNFRVSWEILPHSSAFTKLCANIVNVSGRLSFCSLNESRMKSDFDFKSGFIFLLDSWSWIPGNYLHSISDYMLWNPDSPLKNFLLDSAVPTQTRVALEFTLKKLVKYICSQNMRYCWIFSANVLFIRGWIRHQKYDRNFKQTSRRRNFARNIEALVYFRWS
jgi:hypothetical protein